MRQSRNRALRNATTIITTEDFSANMMDIFKDVVQVRLMEDEPDQVAFALESQLIKCYGFDNVCNETTPTHVLVVHDAEAMDEFAYYNLLWGMHRQYNSMRFVNNASVPPPPVEENPEMVNNSLMQSQY